MRSQRPRAEESAFPLGIKTLYEHPDAVVDIVFIHGLAGDRERMWTSGRGINWTKELLPAKLPPSRILTFGYDAYIVRPSKASNNRIREYARDLINELARVRVTEAETSRHIIFFAHSLGGIVCKDALQVSTLSPDSHLQAIASLTHAILFAAAPHEGSSLANWASIPASALGIVKSTNVSLLAILHTTSEVRDRIQDDFLSSLQRKLTGPPLAVACLHETLKTGLFTIVPQHSTVLSGYNSISVPANHRDIVRFNKDTDGGFLTIVAELRRWIDEFAMAYGEVGGIDPRRIHRCVESLRFSQMHNRMAATERAADDTCAWILSNDRYRAWVARQGLEKSNGLLWIKGKPGSGKSTLTKYLLERESRLPGSLRLVFFFNARGAELERTLLGLYRSLVSQLVIQKRSRSAMKPFLAKLNQKEKLFGEGKCT